MAAAPTVHSGTSARPAQHNARRVFLTAAALGTAAFLSDLVPGTPGAVLLTLTSSGFAWGVTALFAGFRQKTRGSAVLAGTATLLIATVIYYFMILVISQRWRGGYFQDGSSADVSGLLSVGRAAAFWAIASLCAGPLLGFIGWKARAGSDRESALIIGAAFGLLSANGFHTLIFQTPGIRLGEVGVHFLLSRLLTIILSAIATLYLLRRRRISPATGTFVISAVLSVFAGLLLWRLAELARVLVSI